MTPRQVLQRHAGHPGVHAGSEPAGVLERLLRELHEPGDWAATGNQKFNFSYEQNSNCYCVIRLIALNRAPEATGDHHYFVKVPQVNWQWTANSRLLFESGFAWYRGRGPSRPVEGVGPNDIAIRELSTDFRYNSRADNIGGTGAYARRSMQNNFTRRLNVSYVTGSHNVRTGVWVQQWPNFSQFFNNGAMLQSFRNGVPISVVLYASPLHGRTMAHNIGTYVQDQWTLRLTLNVGVRYDSYRGYAPEVTSPAGLWVPERHFDQTNDLTPQGPRSPAMWTSRTCSTRTRRSRSTPQYGPQWLKVTNALSARVVRLGVQLGF